MTPITAESILAGVDTKAEALAIARDRRMTIIAVEKARGTEYAKPFESLYNDIIDVIAERFGTQH